MKLVPVSPLAFFDSIQLLWPKNICVGCARATERLTTDNHFGYSNVWFEKISYPHCRECSNVEWERKETKRKISAQVSRYWQTGLLIGAAAGILGGILAAIGGLGWWTLAIGAGGVIVGAPVISFSVAMIGEKFFVDPIRRRWKEEHTQLPDLDHPAIRIKEYIYTVKMEGKRSINVLACQCDAYADILLTNPYYDRLIKMTQGLWPRKPFEDQYWERKRLKRSGG